MNYPGNDLDLGTLVGTAEPLRLSRADRARHTYVVGATRTGKTKLLEGMARQDLLAWPDHQCPMVVLDPHGTLFGGLTAYAAAEGLDDWPIVPIDLRRDDMVVSYNLLRRREGVDPAVICRSFVDAILHAWGQSNTNETPRLATWLETLLMLAYERECTLAESLEIIREPALRARVADEVRHVVARMTLQSAARLKEDQFQDRVESTMNRVNRFLSTQLLRATICQTGESLDLAAVLEHGSILLANLSVEGTKIAHEDAAALGSVLLTDLWTAARRRGKREEGGLTPCYVYIDEFQNYVTPAVAKGLSEASGFGLHLTLAHQYPSQLPDQHGPMGTMVLGAVMANAKNKVVFQLEHPEDLQRLALILGRQLVDPDKVKQEIWGTKVVGHELAYLPAYGHSDSHGSSDTSQWSETHTQGHTVASNWGESVGTQGGVSFTDGSSEGENSGIAASEGRTDTEGETASRTVSRGKSQLQTRSESQGTQWNAVSGTTEGGGTTASSSRSQTHSFDPRDERFQAELKRYEYTQMNPAERVAFKNIHPGVNAMGAQEFDGFKRAWATAMNLGESKSEGASTFHSRSTSRSDGGNESRSVAQSVGINESEAATLARSANTALSRGITRSAGRQAARTRADGQSVGWNASSSIGGSEAVSEQNAQSYGEAHTDSEVRTDSVSWQPMLLPVMDKELSSRQFVPIEEQLFRITQFLDGLPDRHCLVRLASMRTPAPLYTRTVEPALTTVDWATSWTARVTGNLPYTLTLPEALRRMAEREGTFRQRLLARPEPAAEPQTARRRVASRLAARQDDERRPPAGPPPG